MSFKQVIDMLNHQAQAYTFYYSFAYFYGKAYLGSFGDGLMDD